MHIVDSYPGGGARHLHNVAPERLAAYKAAHEAKQPLTAEYGDFSDPAILHDIQEGDDGIVREVGLAKGITGLIEHAAAGEINGLKVWLQKREIIGF